MNIRKIAEKAGVSVATISRVLNHPELVSQETRDHVFSIMQENHYTPNWFARNLNIRQTRTIAFFYPSNESQFLQMVASGVETVALNKQNFAFLCNTRSDAKIEEKYLDMVLARNVDGVILFSPKLSEERLHDLAKKEIPCVYIDCDGADKSRMLCYINYEDAAFRLAEHILHMGYESLYLLLDDLLVNEAARIKAGFERAMAKDGKGVRSEVFVGDRTIQGGMLFTQRLIKMGALPRAMITASAAQAFGVMKAAKACGIDVPDRLAVAAMTDSSMATLIEPSLTAVDRPGKRLGMVAARMLFDCIENRDLIENEPQQIELLTKLAIRKSCGNTKFIYELFD
jgi:LacI family transcriptional regulator